MLNFSLPRLDKDEELSSYLRKYCRLRPGDIWEDKQSGHKVGCLDATDIKAVQKFFGYDKAVLAIQDPPYNLVAFKKRNVQNFIKWCVKWVQTSDMVLTDNSSLYVWLGADQKNNLEPFADFILMMKSSNFNIRSFITMRNQRGYGTQKNWMSVRQELLYYIKGNPVFNTKFVYTDIPKVVKGYFKEISGKKTENLERSKSDKIRAGNVWIDIQQVFHLMEENVNGCFAQKPLKAIERIINVSSNKGDIVSDYFSHSGTTLLGSERLSRICYTIDIEPIYCEISIRRIENYRTNGKIGWQNSNPFAEEIAYDKKLKSYLENKYDITVPQNL